MEEINSKKIKVLVTGANGFLGYNFISKLKEMSNLLVYEYCSFSTDKDLKRFCKDCDFVFHFAGVIKSSNEKNFWDGNVNLTKKIISFLKCSNNKAPIIFTSSIWVEHSPDHIYSITKLKAEQLILNHSKNNGIQAYIYRLNNLYGPYAEPYYGGVAMTFAYNLVHDIPLTINDPNKTISLTYVNDLIGDFLNIIYHKVQYTGPYYTPTIINSTTVEKLAETLTRFKNNNSPQLNNDFEKKLFEMYSYYYDNYNDNNFKKITILFSTCEKYHETWAPFFKLFKKYGEGLTKCNIIFNSERTIYNDEELNIISTAQFQDMSNKSWGERIKFALSLIKTDYVLFLLEDYYPKKHVDGLTILKCLDYMEKDKSIGCFNFESLANLENEKEIPFYCLIPNTMQYRFNAQTAVWKKDILDKSILPEESPWDWEIYGNQRNAILMNDIKIYCLKYGSREPFYIDYYEKRTDWQGYHINRNGVMKGKWYVSFIDPLFKSNNISVNYSNLGVYKPKYYKFSWLWYFFGKSTRKIRKCKLFNKKEYLQKKWKYENLVKKYIENGNNAK